MLSCVIFEDEHLLVVNKPAGWNTHAPSPFAGEGIYDWLRNREPRWATLAIIHRLDKETSGVLVIAKTPLANRSLTDQFTQRTVRKKYLLLTDREVPGKEFAIKSCLVRAGEKYVSRPLHSGGEVAETRFWLVGAYGKPIGEKLQAPGSKLQGGTKHQEPNARGAPARAWDLEIGASLELGAWGLELRSQLPRIGCCKVLVAEPVTGRTHQIRVHAAG